MSAEPIRPALKVLRHVGNIKLHHLRLLQELAETCTDGNITALDLLRRYNDCSLQFFEVASALVATEIVDRRAGRELGLYGIVGSGILRVAEDVVSDLQVIAREYDCRTIGSDALNPKWAKLAERLGFRPETVHYVMGV